MMKSERGCALCSYPLTGEAKLIEGKLYHDRPHYRTRRWGDCAQQMATLVTSRPAVLAPPRLLVPMASLPS